MSNHPDVIMRTLDEIEAKGLETADVELVRLTWAVREIFLEESAFFPIRTQKGRLSDLDLSSAVSANSLVV